MFVVSDTTRTESDQTQLFRDDTTTDAQIYQIITSYIVPPANGQKALFKKYVGSMRFDRTLRTTCLDVILPKRLLPQFRPYVNSVNDKPFNGLPAAFWKFNDWSTTTEDLGISYKIQVQLNADVNRDWSSYDVLRDKNNGQIITVKQAALNDARKRAINARRRSPSIQNLLSTVNQSRIRPHVYCSLSPPFLATSIPNARRLP